MTENQHPHSHLQHTCCPSCSGDAPTGMNRRSFLTGLGTVTVAGMALSGCSWNTLAAVNEPGIAQEGPPREKLNVQPIFLYSTPERREQTSWRSWGGIQTDADAKEEEKRIKREMDAMKTLADFPVEFRPLASMKGTEGLKEIKDLDSADALVVYAAGGHLGHYNEIAKLGKDTIFFLRHESGPVYLWYEIVSPRFLRQHTDANVVEHIDSDDVVVDKPEDVVMRLRALCGLKNTRGARIIAVGGPAGWAHDNKQIQSLVEQRWGLQIETVPYEKLGKLIQEARDDKMAVARAKDDAAKYLKTSGTTLETSKKFVENAFLLEQVFLGLMRQADCRMITINSCMGTIMPMSETSACLPLSLLNDSGYLAFCESDFVVIPSGILMNGITGNPVFLNDPTFPHHGVITLAHCTGPRRMDGKNMEPARILTHFESDYGAAPKVNMKKGQTVTNIVPDFNEERWVGLKGEIVDSPFMAICRSQIDIKFDADPAVVARRMPGFHWMTGYGDYTNEIGYALKKTPIQWDHLV